MASGLAPPAAQRPILSISSDNLSASDWTGEMELTSSPIHEGDDLRRFVSFHSSGQDTSDYDDEDASSTQEARVPPGAGEGEGRSTTVLFEHLARIKVLQDDIAKMHAALEDLDVHEEDSGDPASSKGMRKDWWTTLNASSDDPAAAMGKTKEQKEETAKAYQKMGEEFDERQHGVDAIMIKMNDLSASLKEFHALPFPVLFPPSTARSTATSRTQDTTGRISNLSAAIRAETAPHLDEKRPHPLRRTGSFT